MHVLNLIGKQGPWKFLQRADWTMEDQRASSLGISTSTMKKVPKFNPTKKHQKVSDNNASDDICWYHYKFGQNAHKCIKLCTFKATEGIQSIHPNNTEDGFSSGHAGQLAASATSNHSNRLFYTWDHSSGQRFLIDSGEHLPSFCTGPPQESTRRSRYNQWDNNPLPPHL